MIHAASRTRLGISLSLDADDQWYYTAPSGHVFLIQQVLLSEFPLALNAEPDDLTVVRVDGMRCREDGGLSRMAVTGWAVHWASLPDYIREAASAARDEEARRLWRLWAGTRRPRS